MQCSIIQSCSSYSKKKWSRFSLIYLIPSNGKELLITSKCLRIANTVVEWVIQYIIDDFVSFFEMGCIVVAIHVIVLDTFPPIEKSHYSERSECSNHGRMYHKIGCGTVFFKDFYRFMQFRRQTWFRRCFTSAVVLFLDLLLFLLVCSLFSSLLAVSYIQTSIIDTYTCTVS